LFLFAAVPAGIGFGIINTTATAVTSVAENKTNKILQTYYSAFFSMGMLLGGLCSGLYRYLEFNSYILFFILILFGLISTLFVFNFGLKKQYDEIEKTEKFKIPENKLLIYSLYLFLFFATVTAIVDWAPLWFEKELLTSSLIASLTIVSWFSGETISKFFGAILIETFNEKIIGCYLPLLGAIIYLIIVFFGNYYLILIGLFVLGFATANFVPIIIRLALKSTTENVNTATANLITLGFLGFLLGPAIIGYTSEIYSIHFNVIAISFLWVLIFSTFPIIVRKFTDL
jgi:fucose permease